VLDTLGVSPGQQLCRHSRAGETSILWCKGKGRKQKLNQARYKPSFYVNACSNNRNTFTNCVFLSNITHFPKDLQQWIKSPQSVPPFTNKFPTNPRTAYNERKAPPPMLNDRMLLDEEDALLEIVSKNNSLIKIYHKDIESPIRFIPVQNSMDKDDPGRASQYCFVSKSMSYQRLPSQRGSSPYNEAHCIQAGAIENDEASILKDVTLNWQKNQKWWIFRWRKGCLIQGSGVLFSNKPP